MVEGVRAGRGVGPASPAHDNTRTAEGQFSVDDHAAPLSHNARVSNVAGIGLESMLTLQAVDEKTERDRSARKRGTAMVAALTDLQRAMLAQDDPSQALRSLGELATDGSVAEDPALGAILRAITLRTRIELARRRR